MLLKVGGSREESLFHVQNNHKINLVYSVNDLIKYYQYYYFIVNESKISLGKERKKGGSKYHSKISYLKFLAIRMI